MFDRQEQHGLPIRWKVQDSTVCQGVRGVSEWPLANGNNTYGIKLKKTARACWGAGNQQEQRRKRKGTVRPAERRMVVSV